MIKISRLTYLPIIFLILFLTSCTNHYPGFKALSHPTSTVCLIHNEEMKKEKIPVYYGLPARTPHLMAEWEVSKKLFPNAYFFVGGGCVTTWFSPKKVSAYYCKRCRESQKKWEMEYDAILKARLTAQDTSSRYFLPKNLQISLEELRLLLNQELILEIKAIPTSEGLSRYDDNLKLWMKYKWALKNTHNQPSLNEYFIKLGVTDPDDMTSIILESFWRQLNGKPLYLRQQILKRKALFSGEM